MHKAEEDYLKMIYELDSQLDTEFIKSSLLAEQFGYTVQSVNEMVKRMERKGFVRFKPYKGVKLTKKGLNEAIRMIRAHRLWEVFLAEKLDLSWENLHEEAEKLEHATSPLVLDKLYAYLDEPTHCNHGNPIPDHAGHMVKPALISLYDSAHEAHFKIERVLDHKPLLTYLGERNIGLYDTLKIVDIDQFSGIFTVEHQGKTHPISKNIARMIFGTPF